MGSGQIDLTGAAGTLLNMAFSVPRDGVITALEAFFSATAAIAVLGDITIRAQLYTSPSPATNTFDPIPGTLVSLTPNLTTPITLGEIARGSLDGLSIPVSLGDRIILVFSAVAEGLTVAATVLGYASAGINID